MPQTDYTSVLLDMEDLEVENLSMNETEIILDFHLQKRIHECPCCHTLTEKVHDYRIQKVKDIPVQGKHLLWRYRKRRYVCPECGKKFYEKNYLLPKWHRITNRLAMYSIVQLEKRISQKDIAEQLGVSPSTINRWLKLVSFGQPKNASEVISIDEFKGNAEGEKFQSIVTDLKNKQVIDVLRTRKSDDVAQYLMRFKNRDKVKYIVMDMSKTFFEAFRGIFPNAKIVIDKFHVSRYCTWAFENVRKSVQKSMSPADRKYFKRSRKLLLKKKEQLSEEENDAVTIMLKFSEDLKSAYLLKEYFYKFMASKNSSEAKENLKWFRKQAEIAKLKEFKSVLTMLDNWQKYILNAFDCEYTNGFTEGINNSIKVIKRTGFGYRNFENFRNRILLIHRPIKIHPHSGWYFLFGHSPNNTSST